MDDKEFFDKALQLSAPWFVRSVRLDLKEKNAACSRENIER